MVVTAIKPMEGGLYKKTQDPGLWLWPGIWPTETKPILSQYIR